MARPLLEVPDGGAQAPVHRAPMARTGARIDAVREERVSETHTGAVELDHAALLGFVEQSRHAGSEHPLEQLDRRLGQRCNGQERLLDARTELRHAGTDDLVEARRKQQRRRRQPACR